MNTENYFNIICEFVAEAQILKDRNEPMSKEQIKDWANSCHLRIHSLYEYCLAEAETKLGRKLVFSKYVERDIININLKNKIKIMKTINKPEHYCDHCNKHGLNKGKMNFHELVCSKNPINDRPCFHCQHLDKKEITIYREYYGNREWKRTLSLLYCLKKECFLYTPKNEIKENQFDLGDEENNPMPKECEFYKYK